MVSLKRLGILYLSTCVGLGYGSPWLCLEAFLGSVESIALRSKASRHQLSALNEAPEFPKASGYYLKPGHPSPGRPILLRPSITRQGKYRNMNRFAFDYAFRPRLRCRLTLGGLTWPRKPWTFGVRVSRPHFRYSCQHPHFPALHHGLHHSFTARGTLPYQRLQRNVPQLRRMA